MAERTVLDSKQNALTPGQPFNPYRLFVGSFIPNALMQYPHLTPSAKLCWARLAQYAGDRGECYPSQDALATEIGVTKRHINRIIKELVDKKFIKRVPPRGIDRLKHKNTVYVFLWHPIFGEDPNNLRELYKTRVNPPEENPRSDIDVTSGDDVDVTSGGDINVLSGSDMDVPRRESYLKESYLRESYLESKTTTTVNNSVDTEKLPYQGVVVSPSKVKKKTQKQENPQNNDEIDTIKALTLNTCYQKVPIKTIQSLIEEQGFEKILLTTEKLIYQLKTLNGLPPRNPTAHFIAMCRNGMDTPEGFVSSAERKRIELDEITRRRKEWEELERERSKEVPQFFKEFLNTLNGKPP